MSGVMSRILVLALCLVGVVACSPQKKAPRGPTHAAQIVLPQSQYGALLSAFDAEMTRFGLTRYGAAPGLSKLSGRDVLLAAYQDKAKSKTAAALDMSDLRQAGHVEIFANANYFSAEPQTRDDFLAAVNRVIAPYGASLKER